MEESKIIKKINLYHLIWGGYAIDCNEPILPRVPVHTIKGEDTEIKRICTAPSLDECLTGLGPTFLGLSFLKELKLYNKSELDLSKITLPFTVVKFCVDEKDSDVWLPDKVINYVPDAWMTQECWLLRPTMPSEAERLWLVNGKIYEEVLTYEGEKYIYYIIVDSEWSKEERKPDEKFLKDIFKVTRKWLKQDFEMVKEEVKEAEEGFGKVNGSLESKMSAAAGKRANGCVGVKNKEKGNKNSYLEFGC